MINYYGDLHKVRTSTQIKDFIYTNEYYKFLD